ncbi:MAG: hypothetical protein ACLR4Z_01405 [Butyricicoccaceae bacterium]
MLREKWEKPRGSSIERYAGDTRDYYIDDVPLAENTYKRRIAELIDERQFKLLTDVWAVTKGMHWKDRRTLLAEICGLPEDKQLLSTAPQFAEAGRESRSPDGGRVQVRADEAAQGHERKPQHLAGSRGRVQPHGSGAGKS